ncbi:hypothetical protein P2R12_06175 [Cytobacillus oceanisediminis]|uniref:hypothetical protein n=1 Tax=Cytobacillus oceanisediminis TaxID=665099 RepID=UPI0023DA57D6|nr:hypothetical protein [Cytobacillus oceanisediminis]MDF2036580.1 hypothetical protein [Cytobacillus oceanisediminis]
MNEDRAYGLKADAFDFMKLPRSKSWEKAIEKYQVGKVVTIDKVNFEISKVELSLPVEAFATDGKPSDCEDYYLGVYFKLAGSEVNPTDIIVQLG